MLADNSITPKQAEGQLFGGVKMSEFKKILKYAEANTNYKLLRSKVFGALRDEKYILFGVSTTTEETSFYTTGISFIFYNVGIGKTP